MGVVRKRPEAHSDLEPTGISGNQRPNCRADSPQQAHAYLGQAYCRLDVADKG